jgi:hypothetical protein
MAVLPPLVLTSTNVGKTSKLGRSVNVSDKSYLRYRPDSWLMMYICLLRSASQQAGMGERILRVRCAGYRVVPVLVVAGLRHAPVPPHHHPPGEGVHPQVIR